MHLKSLYHPFSRSSGAPVMGGAVQVRTELDQIAARLQDDGLAPAAGPEERQCHLWRELVGSEGKLQAASQELQTLRTQQAGEMKEVSCDMDTSYPRSYLLHKATVRRLNWQREDAQNPISCMKVLLQCTVMPFYVITVSYYNAVFSTCLYPN